MALFGFGSKFFGSRRPDNFLVRPDNNLVIDSHAPLDRIEPVAVPVEYNPAPQSSRTSPDGNLFDDWEEEFTDESDVRSKNDPILPENLHKIILDCRGRTQNDMLRAAAATASIVYARKPEDGKIELWLELPPDIFEKTEGKKGFELQVLNALRKLDEAALFEPRLLKGAVNGERQEGLLQVRIDTPQCGVLPGIKPEKSTGRHIITAYLHDQSAAYSLSRRMGAGCKVTKRFTKGAEPVYVIQSTVIPPDTYIKRHIASAEEAVRLAIDVVVDQGNAVLQNRASDRRSDQDIVTFQKFKNNKAKFFFPEPMKWTSASKDPKYTPANAAKWYAVKTRDILVQKPYNLDPASFSFGYDEVVHGTQLVDAKRVVPVWIDQDELLRFGIEQLKHPKHFDYAAIAAATKKNAPEPSREQMSYVQRIATYDRGIMNGTIEASSMASSRK